MKYLFITITVMVISIQVNAQRSINFEVFTNSFFYQNQEINTNKKIHTNDIRQFYLTVNDTWMFLHANGSIQKSSGSGFTSIDNAVYRDHPSYSKEPATFFFPISEEEYYLSTGKELIFVKPDNTAQFLASEKDFRQLKPLELNIVQLTAASKNDNGEVFLAGLNIARKETGIDGVTAGLENNPNGIFKIADGTIEQYDPVPGKPVNVLVCAGNGITWAATDKELLKYEDGAWKVYDEKYFNLEEYFIVDICVDSQNRLWVATNKAVGEFADNEFKASNFLDDIEEIQYQTIHVDDNNIIWLGTRNHGAFMIWNDVKNHYSTTNSPLVSNSVRGIYSTGDNKIIFVSGGRTVNKDEKIISQFGGSGITTLEIDNRYFSKEFKMLSAFNSDDSFEYRTFQTNNGSIYSLKETKLFKVEGGKFEEIGIYPDNKLLNYIQEVAFDSIGQIWAATNHGLKRFDGTASVTFDADPEIAKKQVLHVAADKNGHAWIGTRAGLAKFDGKNWTGYNKKNSALPDNTIKAVFCDSKNNTWVGSKNWLAVIKDGNFTVHDKKTSEIGKAGVFKIKEAPNGDIWMGAGDGLAKYSNGNFEFVDAFKKKYPGDFFIYNDYIIARASSVGIIAYNMATEEFKTYDDFLLSKKVNGIGLVGDEIWIQINEPKKMSGLSPTEKAALEEQRKKIPEEHLRIMDNDKNFDYEYTLIKYPLEKLLERK
ncbi:hypothetical protein OU798_00035 [Prolixibacteraceae bacterium Z1-6]|uniref:Two component regulator propeller n=1 Tax=Draconibacterium aestuarii TaxID=2998507 RepID=A0A9X3J3V6_9BACT|nr:hypothetical protein [Prolixibacteraceae bacterium Z1-6]